MRQVIDFSKEIVLNSSIATVVSISLEHEYKVYSGEVTGEFVVLGEYKIHNDTTTKESFKYRLPFSTILPDNINYETVKLDIVDFTYEQIEDDVLKVDIKYAVEGEMEEGKVVGDIDFEAISDIDRDKEKEALDIDIDDILKDIEESSRDVKDVEADNKIIESEEVVSEARENDVREDDVRENNNIEIVDSNVNIVGNIEDNSNNLVSNEEIIEDSNVIKVKEENDNSVINNVENIENSNIVKDVEIVKGEEKENKGGENIVNNGDEYVTYHIHIMGNEDVIDNVVKSYNGNIDIVKELNDLSNVKVGSKVIIPEYGEE